MGSEDVRVELGCDGFDGDGLEIRIETGVQLFTSSLMLNTAFASSFKKRVPVSVLLVERVEPFLWVLERYPRDNGGVAKPGFSAR